MDTEKRDSEQFNPDDLDSLFVGFIQRKANSVEERLKRQLRGVIRIKVRDKDKIFIFDGSQTTFEVTAGDRPTVDAEIEISTREIESILNKRLNVQIAMLSGRIKVSGNVGLTIYFFNLF